MMLDRQDSNTLSAESNLGVYVQQRRDRRKERLNTDLLMAVSSNNPKAVQKALELGGSPEARCRESLLTACHVAVLSGCSSLCILLEAGANPNLRDRIGRQAHHLAAELGCISCLEVLLEHEPSLINSQVHPQSEPALDRDNMDSWSHNHMELNQLVPQNIVIGSTALHLASKRGDFNCIEYLFGKSANVEVQDTKGLSALDVAGLDMLKENADEKDGNEFHNSRIEMSMNKTVRLLVSKGARIPKSNVILKEDCVVNQCKLCITALHTSVRLRDLVTTEYLIKAGSSLKTWDEAGQTPVHLAVAQESEDFLRFLLSLTNPREAVELRDIQGRTPLHFAVSQGWSNGVELLLLSGSTITSTSNSNQTVLHLAAEKGHSSILRELLSLPDSELILEYRNSMYETALWRAVACMQLECVKILCEHKVDMTVTLPGDYTLLHVATKNNTPEILHFLLQRTTRERVNVVSKGERGGLGPVHLAAKEGHTECLTELLSAGSDPYLKVSGETALHLAARAGHLGAVKALCHHDHALLEVKNEEGLTSLHVAAEEGHAEIVKEMILRGADIGVSIDERSRPKTTIDIILCSIPNSIDFLNDLFDSFIETNDYPTSDPNCIVKIKYDILIPKGRCEMQLKVIDALLNCGKRTVQEKLFLHPLIETFLHYKWKKLKSFYLFIMCLYAVLTISLTTIAHISLIEKTITHIHVIANITAHIFFLGSLVPIIILELLNGSQMKRYYLLDYESWIKWSVIISTGIVATTDLTLPYLRYLASISVLLAWIELFFLLSRFPTFGYYVHMFSSVALNVFKVLATFACLIIGFSFAFLVHFEASEPFGNMLEALIKVLVMTIEFDYEDMFEKARDLTPFSIVGRLLFAFFVVLVAMVMMNLITSLSVSDISLLKAQGQSQRLAKQAGFLSLLEHCLFPKSNAKGFPPQWRRAIIEHLSVPKSMSFYSSRSLNSLPTAIKFNILDNINSRRTALLLSKSMTANTNHLQGKLNSIIRRLNEANKFEDSKILRSTLKEILSELTSLRASNLNCS